MYNTEVHVFSEIIMIWIRKLTMTNLRVIHSARSRIKIPSEDAKVLYWSACYGLGLAATTFQAGVIILQIKVKMS